MFNEQQMVQTCYCEVASWPAFVCCHWILRLPLPPSENTERMQTQHGRSLFGELWLHLWLLSSIYLQPVSVDRQRLGQGC